MKAINRLLVGAALQDLSRRLEDAISSLQDNLVAKLDPGLCKEALPFLPPGLQGENELFGLNLATRSGPGGARSGWLYSQALEFWEKVGAGGIMPAAVCKDGLFTELGQFEVGTNQTPYLGIGQDGARILEVLLHAESEFDSGAFDSDGYAR